MTKIDNQLQKLLYEFQLANGTNLVNFDKLEQVIKEGYEANPDVYSIVNYLANMYVGVPKKPYRKLSNGEYQEITDPSIIALVNKANQSETIMQFNKLRYLFFLATGNSFVYAPRFLAGNNKGQLTELGRINMPSQYTEIISGGWTEPVKGYIINYSYTSTPIPVNEVIHVKMPNLDYQNGQNFYGLSPIKVASAIIQSQNGGYTAMGSTLKRGFPSGILSKENELDSDTGEVQKRLGIFKKIWQRYYSKAKNSGEPIITAGKVSWTQLGFSNFKDLQIIETSQHGLRVLCNVYQIPSIILNDIAGTTFNNQKEARKAVYSNRIKPDADLFDEVDNVGIWSNYGFEVYSDFSGIAEMQEDKKQQADVINIAQQAGAKFTGNEIRKLMDMDEVNEPIMNERFIPMGLTPASQANNDSIEETLKRLNVDHYLK